jgi:hypothetical protein
VLESGEDLTHTKKNDRNEIQSNKAFLSFILKPYVHIQSQVVLLLYRTSYFEPKEFLPSDFTWQ